MVLTAKTAKITAESDIFRWGGCFSENGLFIVLEVTGDEKGHAAVVGKQIFDLLLTDFTNIREKDKDAVSMLLEPIHANTHVKSIVIGLMDGENLFIGGKGSIEVILGRNGKFGMIASGEGIVSGSVMPGDVVLFSTEDFSQGINTDLKIKLLSVQNTPEALEIVAPHVVGNKNIIGSAGLLLQVVSQEQPEGTVKEDDGAGEGKKQQSEGKAGGLPKISLKMLESVFENRFGGYAGTKQKKVLILVITLLSVLLVVSIYFNINKKSVTSGKMKLDQAVSLVTHQYEEAVNLIDLNPARARMLLSNNKLTLTPLLKDYPKNSTEYKKIEELLSENAKQETAAYRIYRLTSVPLFFDLSLIKQGGIGRKIAYYKQMMVILDTQNKVLYWLSTDKKKSAILVGSDTVKDAANITIHGDYAYLLNSDGIYSVDIENKSGKNIIKKDEKWGDMAGFAAYGGNLYLLDKGNNTVWKYIATENGFSDLAKYLNPDVRVDFSNAANLEIDGSIWISEGGNLQKFTKGLRDNFSFQDFSDSLEKISSFATDDTDKHLYVLDQNLSRIVVFDKDGVYQSQYQWDELKNADDIYASEEDKKIYVLLGPKIYGIDIK